MGDRANVYVVDELKPESGTYLYTHWGGHDLKETVASALDRGRGRWTDDSYLARIIFCEMVKGHELEETGYGISATMRDNDDGTNDVIVIDSRAKSAGLAKPGDEQRGLAGCHLVLSFEEFIMGGGVSG